MTNAPSKQISRMRNVYNPTARYVGTDNPLTDKTVVQKEARGPVERKEEKHAQAHFTEDSQYRRIHQQV